MTRDGSPLAGGVVVLVAAATVAAGLPLGGIAVPAAAQSAPTAACEYVGEEYPEVGDEVVLDASETTDAEEIDFDLKGDSNFEATRDASNPFYETTFESTGDYAPLVRAVNAFGNDTTDCGVEVTVAPNDAPSATFSVDERFPEPGDDVIAVADATDADGTVDRYRWVVRKEGEFYLDGSGTDFAFVPETAGNYSIELTVTDNDGANTSVVRTVTVAANDPPSVGFDVTPDVPTAGNDAVLNATATDTDGTISFYEWRVDGEPVGEQERIDYVFPVAGSYRVNLTVTDDDGDTASAARTVRVVANHPPTVRASATPNPANVSERVVFDTSASTDPDGSIVERRLDVGDDGTIERRADLGTIEYRFERPGTYTANLTLVDDDGATNSTLLTVVVEGEGNEPPTAAIGANRTTVFTGEAIRFEAEASDPDGEVASYEWDFDGDGVTNATGRTAVTRFGAPRQRGTVTLTVTDDDGAVATARQPVSVLIDLVTVEPRLNLTLNVAPTAAFSVRPSSPVTFGRGIQVPAGRTITFDASASSSAGGSIAGYEWDLDGDGTTDATGPVVTRTYTSQTLGSFEASLTVTDGFGTATATKNLTVTFRPPRNAPPEANLAVSPSVAEPGQTVRIDAINTSDPDDLDRSLTYRYYFDGSLDRFAGGGTPTLAFTDFDTNGTHNVTLVVEDPAGATDRATVLVEVRIKQVSPTANFTVASADGAGLTARPGERLTFDSRPSERVPGRLFTGRTWSFGDGTTARGRTVTHSFGSRGTYDVALTVRDDAGFSDTIVRTVSVRERNEFPTIGRIAVDTPGTALSDVPFEKTFTAKNIAAADPIDEVTFLLVGAGTVTDTDGSDGWSATFDVGQLDGDATVFVLAEDTEGDVSDLATARVDVEQPPGWFTWLGGISDAGATTQGTEARPTGLADRLLNGTVNLRVPDQGNPEIVVNRTIVNPPLNVTVKPSDRIGKVELRMTGNVTVVYDTITGATNFSAEGTVRTNLIGTPVPVSIEGSANLTQTGAFAFDLVSAEIDIETGRPTIKRTIPFTYRIENPAYDEALLPNVGPDPIPLTVRLDTTIRPKLTAKLFIETETVNGTEKLNVTGGQVTPDIRAFAKESVGNSWVGGTARLDARARGTIPFFPIDTSNVRVDLTFTAKGHFLFLEGGFSATGTINPRFDDGNVSVEGATFQGVSGGIGTRALSTADGATVTRSSTSWLGTRSAASTEPATVARALAVSDDTTGRLTEDAVDDGPPSVAAGNGTFTAAWAGPDPAKNDTAGREVYVARSSDGRNWTAPVALTDDRAIDNDPAVAATGDLRLVAWTRVAGNVNRSNATALLASTEIAYAVADGSGTGSGFSASTLVTGGDGLDLAPSVAAGDGDVLIAWVNDPDADRSTAADRRVRWTVYDPATGVGPIRTIRNATAVGVAADGSGYTLAYLESDDGSDGAVVRATVADGVIRSRARYPARDVGAVAAGPGAAVWTAGSDANTTLEYATAAGTASLGTGGVLGVEDLAVVDDAGQPVVVYRATPLGGTADRVFARRLVDGEWLPPGRVAGVPTSTSNATLSAAAVAPARGGLLAVLAGSDAPGAPDDLFSVRRRFGPDLAVSASAVDPNARVGDRAAVEYAVRNVGGRPANATIVVLENATGAVRSTSLGPLGVGERASGRLTGRVGADGRLTVRVDAAKVGGDGNRSNDAATVVLARADLAVANVTERRRGGDVVVTALVENRGPVPVENASYRLAGPNGTLAAGTVDVAGGDEAVLRLRVDSGALAGVQRLRLDPGDAIDEREERNNGRAVALGRPELDVAVAGANTPDAIGGVLANAFVGNAGTGDASAVVALAANGSTLRYRLPVRAAAGGTRTVERARLYHPATAGRVDAVVEPATGSDADSLDNAAAANLSAAGTVSGTAPLPRIADVRVTGRDGDTVTVRVVLATDADVATGVPVTVSADGTARGERTVVVPANGSRTVELNASVGDATRLTVAAPGTTATAPLGAPPDVNGDGRAATDPDGDGEFEDVDGSGDFSIVDVAVLLDEFDRPAVQNSAALFDFDGSGGVNIVDVAVLLDQT